MSGPSLDTDRIQDYLEASQAVAVARVRFAQEYEIEYFRSKDGFMANQVAIEKTRDELTVLKARFKIAEERMVRE
jgi:hypothetical protein